MSWAGDAVVRSFMAEGRRVTGDGVKHQEVSRRLDTVVDKTCIETTD